MKNLTGPVNRVVCGRYSSFVRVGSCPFVVNILLFFVRGVCGSRSAEVSVTGSPIRGKFHGRMRIAASQYRHIFIIILNIN
jgi:hypothetical protein